ncbi:MAG: hypothetical protein ACLT0Y_08535 [Christensenellales bacterium]
MEPPFYCYFTMKILADSALLKLELECLQTHMPMENSALKNADKGNCIVL